MLNVNITNAPQDMHGKHVKSLSSLQRNLRKKNKFCSAYPLHIDVNANLLEKNSSNHL